QGRATAAARGKRPLGLPGETLFPLHEGRPGAVVSLLAVLAIAAGISDGLGFGANAMAAGRRKSRTCASRCRTGWICRLA
ncbi:hypothetical protein ACSHWI_16090, partial [Methylococcus sp. S2T]|uniref:hypothetical protein n=1 Tax=Methylococcus sp. S2T TaxID=3438967 RepID=UPI003EDAEE14